MQRSLYRMMSLPPVSRRRFQAIATLWGGHLNRLEVIYGSRIFPDVPENAKIVRNGGFSGRQDGPDVSGRRQPSFTVGLMAAPDHSTTVSGTIRSPSPGNLQNLGGPRIVVISHDFPWISLDF